MGEENRVRLRSINPAASNSLSALETLTVLRPSCSAKEQIVKMTRIGGDELLVLCLGIEEKDLREHVEKLRMDMKEHQVTMAVGMIWKERGPKDIDLLLNESERLMYEDKDRYYKEHGLKRRR